MQKLRTLTDASDFLDTEFAWRLREIADIKSSVFSTKGPRQVTLIRAGVALLYAHWEGFIKIAAEVYVNYVSNRGLRYDQLQACFVARGLKGHLQKVVETKKGARLVEAIEFLQQELSNRASIPFRGVVDTESNLSSKVFADIIVSIGLTPGPYETKYNLIDASLLDRRNRIAHGEPLDVTATDYSALSDEVVGLMRAFKTDVENALVLKSYQR